MRVRHEHDYDENCEDPRKHVVSERPRRSDGDVFYKIPVALCASVIYFFFSYFFSGPYSLRDLISFLTVCILFFSLPVQLWNNCVFSGYSVYAATECQVLYPPRLIFNMLAEPLGFSLFVIYAYVTAACYTYGYLFRLTKRVAASLFAGFVFSLSGFMTYHLPNTSMIHCGSYLPLLIWSLEELRRGFSRFWFLVGIFAVAMSFLAGHPQIFLYTMLISLLYIISSAAGTPYDRRKYIASCLAVLTLGSLLLAFQLLPAAELASLSTRSELTYRQFSSGSLPMNQLYQIVFPYSYCGSSGPDSYWHNWHSYFGKWHLGETTGYVGIGTLFFAGIALAANPKNRFVLFWLFCACISILFAIEDTIFMKTLFHIPLINLFRCLGRFVFLFSFGIAVLLRAWPRVNGKKHLVRPHAGKGGTDRLLPLHGRIRQSFFLL